MQIRNQNVSAADVLHAVIENSRVAFLLFENDQLFYANQRAIELLGNNKTGPQHASDILPSELFELVRSEGFTNERIPQIKEFELRFATGESKWMETTIASLDLDGRSFQQLALKDITNSKRRESELEKAATTDDLSGLSNRRRFRRVLDENANSPVAIAVVDVDHFKSINDSFGHAVGDNAIRFVAGQLLYHFGDELCVARLGGEEFAVVARLEDAKTIEDRFDQFRIAVQNLEFSSHTIKLTVSIGLAFSNGVGNVSELLCKADKALYASKNSGRNRLSIFAE